MRPAPSVLIVDRSEENREVLETALGRRGIQTRSAARASRGLQMARSEPVDLIVLDLELTATEPDELCSRFATARNRHDVPMVLLGTGRSAAGSESGEFISKPYHYAPLIRKIEEILQGK